MTASPQPRAPRVRSEARSPRIREKRRRRRAEILQAALQAFRNKGYSTTTLNDIAQQLDVSKTALYHYFPDKESILQECHQESVAELERILREASRLKTPTAKLTHIIREHVRLMTDTLGGSPLGFEITALSSKKRASLIVGRDQYEHELRKIIEQGMKTGEFRRGNAKVAVFVILGAINWMARWYRPEGTLHFAELGDEFARRLLDGLGSSERPRNPNGNRTRRARAMKRE